MQSLLARKQRSTLSFGLGLTFFIALIATLAVAGCDLFQLPDPVVVGPDTTAPAEVSDLTASPDDTRVWLNWVDPEDSDFHHVEITCTDSSTKLTVRKGWAPAVFSGLLNNTPRDYTFTVKTVDTAGNKSAGTTITATPVAGPPPTTPSAPAKRTVEIPQFSLEEIIDYKQWVTVRTDTSGATIHCTLYIRDESGANIPGTEKIGTTPLRFWIPRGPGAGVVAYMRASAVFISTGWIVTGKVAVPPAAILGIVSTLGVAWLKMLINPHPLGRALLLDRATFKGPVALVPVLRMVTIRGLYVSKLPALYRGDGSTISIFPAEPMPWVTAPPPLSVMA